MKYINGGLVKPVTMKEQYALLPDRIKAEYIVKNRTKKYWYLADRMVMVNPDLKNMLDYVRTNVSDHWYKTITGRIINLMLYRYMWYKMNPQHFQYRGDLILFANYMIIQNFLQRTAGILKKEYGYEKKFHNFWIKKKDLYKLSVLWYEDMIGEMDMMVKHHNRLKADVRSEEEQKRIDELYKNGYEGIIETKKQLGTLNMVRDRKLKKIVL